MGGHLGFSVLKSRMELFVLFAACSASCARVAVRARGPHGLPHTGPRPPRRTAPIGRVLMLARADRRGVHHQHPSPESLSNPRRTKGPRALQARKPERASGLHTGARMLRGPDIPLVPSRRPDTSRVRSVRTWTRGASFLAVGQRPRVCEMREREQPSLKMKELKLDGLARGASQLLFLSAFRARRSIGLATTHPHTAQARDVHAKLSFTPQHRIPLHNGRVCSRLPLPRGRARRLRSAQVRETRNPDSLNPETSRPRSP